MFLKHFNLKEQNEILNYSEVRVGNICERFKMERNISLKK